MILAVMLLFLSYSKKLLVCCVCFFAIFLCDSNILGLVDLSIRVRLFTNLIKGHWSTVEKKEKRLLDTKSLSLKKLLAIIEWKILNTRTKDSHTYLRQRRCVRKSSKLDWSEENELFPTFYRQFKYPKRTNETAPKVMRVIW